MVFLESPEKLARPKEIIEQTFNVFCGSHMTMDMVAFAKFCESSKRVPTSDANLIFSAAVRNVHLGMELSDFKVALGLLVNFVKSGTMQRLGSETSSLLQNGDFEVIKPRRPSSTGKCRSSSENHSNNTPMVKKSQKNPSSFRWSPLDVVDTCSGATQETPSRIIRWCPAELEE